MPDCRTVLLAARAIIEENNDNDALFKVTDLDTNHTYEWEQRMHRRRVHTASGVRPKQQSRKAHTAMPSVGPRKAVVNNNGGPFGNEREYCT